MTHLNKVEGISIASPACYQITVQGRLDPIWSDRLAGMQIYLQDSEERKPISVLVGQLRDQAEMLGVLNGLYALQLPIVSVNLLGETIRESQGHHDC